MNLLAITDENSSWSGLPDLTPTPGGPVKSLAYSPAAGDGQTAVETITLRLEGPPSQIEACLTRLQRALARAEQAAGGGVPEGGYLYLTCRLAPGLDAWRSRLLGGQLALGPGGADQRARGAQDCRLTLRRADWWEAAAGPLTPLAQARAGDNTQGWLDLTNHADAAHGCWFDLPALAGAAENITGDLPAPLVLALGLTDPAYPHPVTFVVGESWRPGVERLSPVYSGENGAARGGAAGSLVSDPTCADGRCLSLTWTGDAEQDVWGVDIPAPDAAGLAGEPVLPALRLGLPAAESLWARWKVYAVYAGAETLCAELPGQTLDPGSPVILGPALNLPPWRVDPSYPFPVPALRLVLAVQAGGSGPHTLAVDALTLLGLDGWRIYRPLTTQGSPGISDDGPRGAVYCFGDHSQRHAAEGPGFTLQPGQAHHFNVLAISHPPGGPAAPIDLPMRVWVQYRPRKRCL